MGAGEVWGRPYAGQGRGRRRALSDTEPFTQRFSGLSLIDGPCVIVAGGGTAGHIEPAMALADAVMRLRPDARVVALGTSRGLENTIVPARGYPLELIPPVPLPRKPTPRLLSRPLGARESIKVPRNVFERVGADVVVGFGGYVALPAYLAARGRLPIVVH